MYSMENGETNARENLSMHPLWEEYRFPQAPGTAADDEAFYYNPYSGQQLAYTCTAEDLALDNVG